MQPAFQDLNGLVFYWVPAKAAEFAKVSVRQYEDFSHCNICCRDIGSSVLNRRIRMFRDPMGNCAIGDNQSGVRR